MPQRLRAPQPREFENRESFSRIDMFELATVEFPDRLNIVSEGDSWFDYPRKIFPNKPANIIDHIEDRLHRKANLLRLESNGDEITQIMSDDQRHNLTELLDDCARRKRPIHALLFSGGGNDIVGTYDMERFLLPFKPGMTARACINWDAFEIKLNQIKYAWLELINIRDQYSADTKIFTHTYDLPYMTGIGARFYGVEWAKAWIGPAMTKRGIAPDDYSVTPNIRFRRDIVQEMFNSLAVILEEIEGTTRNFHVTRTLGTLTSADQWLNEIHPTADGFELLSEKFYATMTAEMPQLPAW
ncbi:hypothetical protein [Kordiimonas lacus]|uniref:GDSL-like Lipase/Acylhydrolase family protein n=1 Tax=Kordiimonas lacus TaxID=637679 RepID=A0A1G7F0J9_9PROT|nr:hypothetical protein [Kordiimonas lacus]SDE69256.1 hypothetical protein SAMN04488071_3559 [Kordiimonas lacus]